MAVDMKATVENELNKPAIQSWAKKNQLRFKVLFPTTEDDLGGILDVVEGTNASELNPGNLKLCSEEKKSQEAAELEIISSGYIREMQKKVQDDKRTFLTIEVFQNNQLKSFIIMSVGGFSFAKGELGDDAKLFMQSYLKSKQPEMKRALLDSAFQGVTIEQFDQFPLGFRIPSITEIKLQYQKLTEEAKAQLRFESHMTIPTLPRSHEEDLVFPDYPNFFAHHLPTKVTKSTPKKRNIQQLTNRNIAERFSQKKGAPLAQFLEVEISRPPLLEIFLICSKQIPRASIVLTNTAIILAKALKLHVFLELAAFPRANRSVGLYHKFGFVGFVPGSFPFPIKQDSFFLQNTKKFAAREYAIGHGNISFFMVRSYLSPAFSNDELGVELNKTQAVAPPPQLPALQPPAIQPPAPQARVSPNKGALDAKSPPKAPATSPIGRDPGRGGRGGGAVGVTMPPELFRTQEEIAALNLVQLENAIDELQKLQSALAKQDTRNQIVGAQLARISQFLGMYQTEWEAQIYETAEELKPQIEELYTQILNELEITPSDDLAATTDDLYKRAKTTENTIGSSADLEDYTNIRDGMLSIFNALRANRAEPATAELVTELDTLYLEFNRRNKNIEDVEAEKATLRNKGKNSLRGEYLTRFLADTSPSKTPSRYSATITKKFNQIVREQKNTSDNESLRESIAILRDLVNRQRQNEEAVFRDKELIETAFNTLGSAAKNQMEQKEEKSTIAVQSEPEIKVQQEKFLRERDAVQTANIVQKRIPQKIEKLRSQIWAQVANLQEYLHRIEVSPNISELPEVKSVVRSIHTAIADMEQQYGKLSEINKRVSSAWDPSGMEINKRVSSAWDPSGMDSVTLS